MGTPVVGRPMWFVEHRSTHPLWSACRIALDDGSERNDVMHLPDDLPIGYHELIPHDGGAVTRLIVHPTSCPVLPRAWGAAAQIYALWSRRSWGIGDLADLRTLAVSLHAAGGRAILVSPLHQPAPSLPQEHSPYFPSSRRSWNPLLIAIDTPPPPDLECTPGSLIDRDAAWAAKRHALEKLFLDLGSPQANPVSDRLDGVAVWNALCDQYGPVWQDWPHDVRRFDHEALLQRLTDDPALARRVSFHRWCQGLVGDQIAAVVATGVDIIGDLAIGISPGGADAWEYQDLLALDVRVGAPPDPFNRAGQEWGIPPFVPWKLRAAEYEPFIETIRSTLRGVQGLRIDHVMGLFRQFWIPAGGQPTDGTYVTFPADELLAIICLEATRSGAFVIGEDLGTVADGVREKLAECSIAGTRVLWFETEPPSTWPTNSLATVTTHDLPTIAGVVTGRDGDEEQRRRVLAHALDSDTSSPHEAPFATSQAVVAQVITSTHDAMLGSPASLRLVSMDDVTGAVERPNHPGTNDHPNWRRRLPVSVDGVLVPN